MERLEKQLDKLVADKRGGENAESVLPYDYFDLINESRKMFGDKPLTHISELSIDELLEHLQENIKGIEGQKKALSKHKDLLELFPYNTPDRIMLGGMLSYMRGCDRLIAVDDDNYMTIKVEAHISGSVIESDDDSSNPT